jgi:hypothetical protein
MRKVLMVAAAAAIALVGLSANTCGGEEKQAEPAPPAATPAEPAPAPEPAAPEPAAPTPQPPSP